MLYSVFERFSCKLSVSKTHFYKGTPCHEYTGHLIFGYGYFWLNRKNVRAHRFIYKYAYGKIDPKLVIHHLCYNRSCCNILHLEQRTHKENLLDIMSSASAAANKHKTHCKHGHEFTLENTGRDSHGDRYCKTCTYLHGVNHSLNNRDIINKSQRERWRKNNVECNRKQRERRAKKKLILS